MPDRNYFAIESFNDLADFMLEMTELLVAILLLPFFQLAGLIK